MDGQAGVALAQAIYDMEPTGRVVEPPRPKVRRNQYQLGMAELGAAALRNTAQQIVKLFQTAPAMFRALRDTVVPEKGDNGKRQWGMPKNFKIFGPRTLLNVSVTNQRTFAGRTISLAEAKLIGKTLGGSLTDVVMCTTAGAMRRYLADHEDLPAKSLLAAIPVSLRAPGDKSSNNQVSMLSMLLSTDIADPVERLHAIRTASNANKAMMGRVKTAIPTDFPLFGAPWLMSGIAAVVSRSRPINLIPPIANIGQTSLTWATICSLNTRLCWRVRTKCLPRGGKTRQSQTQSQWPLRGLWSIRGMRPALWISSRITELQ